MANDSFWVYILNCDNGAFYTGYTTDLIRRYQEHVTGSDKCKYTRSFKPLGVAQVWYIQKDKSAALKLEKFIKKLSHQVKVEIIEQPHLLIYLYNSISYD